ncbi:hypothetical protein PHMEG_00032825 [Phytophthora megakarya]|uniref:Uncharacterized protein n=1 Tax=Phytophthora megakarya TaxID=4795 RepID=A0A225UUW9_9STRA|nr:hypothetical protein PHMEG_00032825 [Phytophthora megakarya]
MWTPIYPTDPPISDRKGSGWNPDDPSDTPTASQNSGNTEAESSSTTGEDVDTTKIGVGDGQWNPTRPANPPKPIHKEELDEKANYSGGSKKERKPEATGWKAPITGQGKQPTNRAYSAFSAFLSNDDTWAYNNYMAGNTNTYTRSIKTPSYPEASAQQYPSIEDTRGDGQQARAYSPYSTNSAYTNADFGSSNAYVESDTNTYMKSHKAQMQREPAAQESPSNEATYEDEQQDRAYSPYSTNSAYTNTEDFGSNNAYVESDTNTYMSSHKAQMQRKPTAQESPSNEAKYAGQQHPRAFNLYSTNSEYTNMESPANNAYADSDKYKYRSIKAQISSEAEVHQSSSGEAPNTNSDRYKYRSIKAQIYPETDGHQPPSNEEIHDNEQPSRAFNADSAYTTNVITGGEKEFTGNAQSEDVLRGEDDDFSRGLGCLPEEDPGTITLWP